MIAQRPDWHLALAGDGPDRPWLLEQLAEQPRLRDKIHWLGQRDDVPSLLKTADVLVLASLWEGMPNVVLEAMAARLPVIGTAVEGTEDLVVPGQTGWLVPAGDLSPQSSPDRGRRFSRAAADDTAKQDVSASNENSRSKQPWRPTNASGPPSWDSTQVNKLGESVKARTTPDHHRRSCVSKCGLSKSDLLRRSPRSELQPGLIARPWRDN